MLTINQQPALDFLRQPSVKATWIVSHSAYDKISRGEADVRSRFYYFQASMAREHLWLVVSKSVIPYRLNLKLNVAPFHQSILVLISHTTQYFDKDSNSHGTKETGFMCEYLFYFSLHSSNYCKIYMI